MDGAGDDFEWPPAGAKGGSRGSRGPGGRGSRGPGSRGPRGPRWVVSLRALVVVLAMLAAALGLLWLEAAGVEGVSAELASQKMGKVQVPPLATGPPVSETTAVGPTGGTGVTGAANPPGATDPPGDAGANNAGEQSQDISGSGEGATPVSSNALVVHVAGAVAHPGVVRVEPGSRVFQAIDAAGGALDTAALSALNLAAPVEDGQQILVPTVDEAATWPPGAGAGAGTQQGQAAGSGAAPESGGVQPLVNINTATEAELQTLPGVGPVLAERIVAWRDDHGAYPSVDALDAVSGIGPKMLAGLRDLVRVS